MGRILFMKKWGEMVKNALCGFAHDACQDFYSKYGRRYPK
jgi:hypothetical protein